MTWEYRALRRKHKGETIFYVCESFKKYGRTSRVHPQGDSLDDLILTLERMVKDMKRRKPPKRWSKWDDEQEKP